MAPESNRAHATTPDELFRFFVKRAKAGDLDGLMELYEPESVVTFQPGQSTVGHDAIRAALEGMLAIKPIFSADGQRPSIVMGDLALTSAVLGSGAVSAEVARRQPDGSWRWVIDNPRFLV